MERNKSGQVISGLYLLASIAVLMGAFFKIQHYPHGSTLFFCGILLGSIAGLIQFRINFEKMGKNKSGQVISGLYLLASIAVLMGAFFKIQHYPHGSTLFFCGILLGSIAGILQFRRERRTIKKLEEKDSEG